MTEFTRRQFLQVGGIGVLGLGLPDLLASANRGLARRSAEKSCIFIVPACAVWA